MRSNPILEISKYIKDLKNFEQIHESKYEYKAREKSTEEIYEVIEILMKDPKDEREKKNVLEHLCYLQTLDNPAIIKFCGFSLNKFNNEKYPLLFTEHMENGSLRTLFQSIREGSPPKGWNNTKMIINIIGISLGMKYLNDDCSVIHNNLTPSTILLDSELYPKITGIQLYTHEFDISTAIQSEIICYSPQLIEGGDPFSSKPGVFAFSMILYEFYTGNKPTIKGRFPSQIYKQIYRGCRPDTSEINSKPIKDLLEKCWNQDPSWRPDFDEIVSKFIDNKNLWPDNVDEGEVQEYLKKFDLSLQNNKSESE